MTPTKYRPRQSRRSETDDFDAGALGD